MTTTTHEQNVINIIRRYESDWEKQYQPTTLGTCTPILSMKVAGSCSTATKH